MSLDSHSPVNYHCRCSHYVIAYHLGYILYFGKFDIKIVLTDYTLNYPVCLFAFGASGAEYKHLADHCAGSSSTARGFRGFCRFT